MHRAAGAPIVNTFEDRCSREAGGLERAYVYSGQKGSKLDLTEFTRIDTVDHMHPGVVTVVLAKWEVETLVRVLADPRVRVVAVCDIGLYMDVMDALMDELARLGKDSDWTENSIYQSEFNMSTSNKIVNGTALLRVNIF